MGNMTENIVKKIKGNKANYLIEQIDSEKYKTTMSDHKKYRNQSWICSNYEEVIYRIENGEHMLLKKRGDNNVEL